MFRNLLAAATAGGLLLGAAGAAQAQCPEPRGGAEHLTVKEGFPVDPKVRPVTAGGNIDLSKCTNPRIRAKRAVGFVTKQPDFVVVYKTDGNGPSRYPLTFRIKSSADTVLLINDPNGGWHFDDDGGNRLNGLLRFPNAGPGRYDVWIGTYERKTAQARLEITELDPGAGGAPQALCPEPRGGAEHLTIKEGFPVDPKVRSVTAGGNIDLSRCTNPRIRAKRALGFVTKQPDFVVVYKTDNNEPSRYPLTFRIKSSADTVLLINDPKGGWHFDDDAGNRLNGKVRFPNAGPGRYDVWVGTYESKTADAKLEITELE